MIIRNDLLLPWMRDYVIALVIGSIIGQACFVCLIGGLAGRTWLSGYVFAVVLASMGVFLFLLGEDLYLFYRVNMQRGWSILLVNAMLVPAFVLAGATPLLVFRGRLGWRLTRTKEQGHTPQSWGVEELLIGTAITASCLIVATSAAEIVQVPTFRFLLPLGVFSCTVAAASLLGVAPAVWLCFRTTSWRRRFTVMVPFVGIVVLVTMSISAIVDAIIVGLSSGGGRTPRFPVLFYSVAISAVSAIVFLTGLTTLILSGYRLFQSIPDSVASTKPLNSNPSPLIDDDASNEVQLGYNVLMHRAIAGLILGFALVVSISTSNLEQSRAIGLTEFQYVAMELGEKGVLRLNANNEPVEIKVSPDTSLDDLLKNGSFRQIQFLSLANCNFGDDDVPKLSQFTALYSLDLEGTQITGECFSTWRPPLLNHLDLSNSGVTDQTLAHVASLPALLTLNLANTEITDAGLLMIAKTKTQHIDLRGTKVTAAGLCESKFAGWQIFLDMNQFTPEEVRRIRNSANIVLGQEFPW